MTLETVSSCPTPLPADPSIGRAFVPLAGLETRCEEHVVVDVVDVASERKKTGGKVEVRCRVPACGHRSGRLACAYVYSIKLYV